MAVFGKLEKVNLREIWANEATQFTPWLADNIDALGEGLGIELELQEREASVGDFSLDLRAIDLGTGKTVIIENQLTNTDHDHLGKLLTYAAGFDASYVIWVSENFREEHRQALDWLNQRTDSDTQFFGIVIEVLKIDDSNPAYNFKPVVFPNEWQKSRRVTTKKVSVRSEAYRDFFQTLIDNLRENHNFTRARIGQPQSWYAFSSGIRGVVYDASFALGSRSRAGLYIDLGDSEKNKSLFDWLKNKQESIEIELGEPIEWERLDDKRASRITFYRSGSIDNGKNELKEIQSWMIERLLKIKEVFVPLVNEHNETS